MIKYVDLAKQWKLEKSKLIPLIEKAICEDNHVNGNHIKIFENSICKLLKVKHCVALNSGTDALVCALVSLGVGRGDEVITPPNSFISSTSAIAHIGAVPVFADVKKDQTIDPEMIIKKITKKTKAIMPVHLTGHLCEMDKIKAISNKYGIPIVEDAAQSILSKYRNFLSGTTGDVGCFSAHPLKNLNAIGDAGFIVTNTAKLAKKIRLMRNHNLIDRNKVSQFGYVSRMDTIQACILNYRIKNLKKIIQKRRENAKMYKNFLDMKNIFFINDFDNYYDTYHTFVIQVKQRNSLQKYLFKKGVETFIHYPIPIHLQKACKAYNYKIGDFPSAERQSKMILSLPIHQYLSTKNIKKICSLINNFYL